MTTPPPPWEAHPPLSEEDGFFGAEPPQPSGGRHRDEGADPDEDTGPVRIVDPRPEPTPSQRYEPGPAADPPRYEPPRPPVVTHDGFANRFADAMTVDPRSQTLRRVRNVHPGLVAASVAGAVLVVVIVVAALLWPSGDDSEDAASAAKSKANAAALEKLKALLPAGYSSDACTGVEAPEGAQAKVTCEKNTDVFGPATSTYTLMNDGAALKAAMENVIASAGIVNCPGNIQSPGPWRRNASPTKVAGNLVCGLPQAKPMIAWTNDRDSLLGMAKAGPSGPTLDQLYKWWSDHS